MGRHQHHMDETTYDFVREECRAYVKRREIIKKGNADDDVIAAYIILNHAFEHAVSEFERAEIEAYCSDIIHGRGWCSSSIMIYIGNHQYVYGKQRFARAIATMLGLA